MNLMGRKRLKERETSIVKAVARRNALADQPTRPYPQRRKRHRRRSRLLPVLSVLLALLIGLDLFLSWPTIKATFWPAPSTDAHLQSELHPDLQAVHSDGVSNLANLFMRDMQSKDWPAMWLLLAPDARAVWAGEQDFVHFEQTKFGALTLQRYTPGQAEVSKPWLDPDTTQVYPAATTLSIALQASAPAGLLTAPSEQALAQGLFQRTTFAAIQNSQGTWQVMLAGPADLDAPVLVPAKTPVSHLLIPIYMYHHVSSIPTHDALDYSLTVTTADFAAQLNWMQAQGYHTITMTELFDTFYYGKALPAKPMMLTFDDGYADIYTYALPLLLAHHYRGVFYIITGMISGAYVTWNEVHALQRSGMQIASHTVHHVNIGQPPKGTTTQEELQVSKAKLQTELQEPIQFFCYPTGEPFHHDSVAEQQIVLQDLFLDGYLSATLDPSSFNSALQNDRLPYELPRIRVSGGETLSEFIGILAETLAEDRLRLQRLHA
jgi:peptidoglycan/xylan/chitin deacetylase (PgdA/CDA1 family)